MKNQILYLLLINLGFLFPALAQEELKIYPNPFKDSLFIISTPRCGDSVKLEIFDRTGRTLVNGSRVEASKPDTIRYQASLPEGIFFLRYTRNETKKVHKIILSDSNAVATISFIISGDSLNCRDLPFEVFPNPTAHGWFSIRQPRLSLPYEYYIFNSGGQLITRQLLQNRKLSNHPVDFSRHEAGTYFILIESKQETVVLKLLLL